MLRPKDIERLPAAMVELYSQVEMDALVYMAERIKAVEDFIPASQWQYQKLIEMGNYHSYIVKALASLTGKTETEIKRLIRNAGQKALRFDDAVYRRAGLDPPPLAASPAIQEVMAAGLENTMGLFDNLTRTTANTSTRQFERTLDRAWLQVSTGAFSHQEATRMAIKELGGKGLASIEYPSGHVDSLDVAVRRAVLTGVNQTALKMQERQAEELGCDLVEVTAHAGARTGVGVADHAGWQGKVYSRSGTHSKYPSLVEKTGYGTGQGLGGWNCRHSMFPFFEGLSEPSYTEAELAELNAPKYEYNGKKLTEEEANSRQRYIERQIRRWRREKAAMKAAGLDPPQAASKLRQWQATQKDFLAQTGLKRQYDRERVTMTASNKGLGAGGASTGSGGTPKVIGTLETFERNDIVQRFNEAAAQTEKLPYEVDYTVTKDGRVWYTKGGTAAVHPERIETEMGQSLEGSYSYHNHPISESHFSLSEDDVGFFFEYRQQYSMASDEKFRYFMERTAETPWLSYEDAHSAFRSIYDTEIRELAFHGEIDIDLDGYHLTMQRLSKEFSFIYRREENRG